MDRDRPRRIAGVIDDLDLSRLDDEDAEVPVDPAGRENQQPEYAAGDETAEEDAETEVRVDSRRQNTYQWAE